MTPSVPVRGSAALSVRVVAGQSAVTEAWSTNPVKLLTPRMRGSSVWSYLSNFGGGLVAGDETSVKLSLGAGTRCFFTSQASTKVYRNPQHRRCSHRLTADLDKDSLLILAPDPVQSFADSIYTQTQEFHLKFGASLVLLDWFSAGRAACGERWSFHRLWSRNDIFMERERWLLDSMLLDRAHGPLNGTHRLGRFNTVALVALVGETLAGEATRILARVNAQPLAKRAGLIFSASAIRGGTLLRVAGERHEEVARYVFDSLGFAGRLLGDDPWARKLN